MSIQRCPMCEGSGQRGNPASCSAPTSPCEACEGRGYNVEVVGQSTTPARIPTGSFGFPNPSACGPVASGEADSRPASRSARKTGRPNGQALFTTRAPRGAEGGGA